MSIERYEVAKAGGWSLASAERVRSVMDYLHSNPDIHYFVPSAPGAINDGDIKVTDRLIACCRHRERNESFEDDLGAVDNQFITIAKDLGYFGIEKLLDPIEQGLRRGENYDWVISRGEAVNGRMWSDLLGWRFIDPTELIRFRKDDRFDERSYRIMSSRLRGYDRFVIPGFYGLGADGKVKTFPRDGSDVTGSIIARGVNARLYRNLTNTDGVLSADPKIVKNTRSIRTLTFKEYRELGNGGVKVLHRDTIVPVVGLGIPINVRHSEKPESHGTMVITERPSIDGEDVIGTAGKGGFVSLKIHKYGMNDEIGIESRALQILKRHGISIEHVPSGTDYISIIFDERQLKSDEDEIIWRIQKMVRPDRIWLEKNLGLLSVVGQGICDHVAEVAGRLFSGLHGAAIPVRAFTFGTSGISIVVAVDNNRLDDAVRLSHDLFIK